MEMEEVESPNIPDALHHMVAAAVNEEVDAITAWYRTGQRLLAENQVVYACAALCQGTIV